jgi:superfamily I DNA/RNA helicase|tara:strand:- start:423 stop:2048 length:1626 start_codon:yes stop_codon:yes gene_type:complete
MKKIRVAGPPGTGKTTYLVERYYDALDTYQALDIMVLSHTRTASNHIREKIDDPESIKEYHKKTGKDLFHLIRETKKIRKKNVSTIHKYCKDKQGGLDTFDVTDYDILKSKYPIFNKHTLSKKFSFTEGLFKGHPFFKFQSFARDNGKDLTSYYRTLSFEEKEEYKYAIQEFIQMNSLYLDYKTNPLINNGRSNILDFQDMVENFCSPKYKDPGIKVLMVDEAQDSSVIQRKAELKMSKNCDLLYKAGDPDQSIFEFAGADPDSFHKEFARPEVELDIGYRCPKAINNWCREVIKDVWDHYGYTRKWTPRTEGGKIVEGKIYPLMNLSQDPSLHVLIDKLINTKETFIFTYRAGEPSDMLDFLVKLNLPIKVLSDKIGLFSYPTREIDIQRTYLSFSKGEAVSLAKAKKIIKAINSDYHGPNYNLENLDNLDKKPYTIDYFIEKKYILPIIKKTNDFQTISANKDLKNYIRSIVSNNRDLEKARIFIANIHTIKGMEFDHVVLDLKITREEPKFTKKRLKFVAGSRARKSLWVIKSMGLSL